MENATSTETTNVHFTKDSWTRDKLTTKLHPQHCHYKISISLEKLSKLWPQLHSTDHRTHGLLRNVQTWGCPNYLTHVEFKYQILNKWQWTKFWNQLYLDPKKLRGTLSCISFLSTTEMNWYWQNTTKRRRIHAWFVW